MERFVLIIALFLPLVTPAVLPPACETNSVDSAKESSKAIGNLAVKLYRQIAKPHENVIFSPVSIALALALVENGANGETKREIEALLSPTGSDRGDSASLYQSLQHQLQIQNAKARLSIANGLFYSEHLRLKSDYVSKLQRCFETQIAQEPFQNDAERAREQINRWVSNATADRIPELFKQGTIDGTTMAVLANAIYMKASWAEVFRRTEELSFYQSGKSDQEKKISFIVRRGDYGYASSDAFDTVSIPYDQVPLSMYIVLPKQRDGLDAVEKSLKGDQLISLFGQTQNRQVLLKLPKFTMRQGVDLKSVLGQMGIRQMFTNGADFSRLAEDPLVVTNAVHEAFIKVNENGTEAAAATGFAMSRAMAMLPPPADPIPFVADHPFLFAIVHEPTKAIVFMGRVETVQQQE